MENKGIPACLVPLFDCDIDIDSMVVFLEGNYGK